LRLPYGKRTGVEAIDQLNIVAHDRFQEIVDDSRRADSPIHLKELLLDDEDLRTKTVTVVSQSQLAMSLGLPLPQVTPTTVVSSTKLPLVFAKPEEQKIAQITYEVIRSLENEPQRVASVSQLLRPEMQAEITRKVEERYAPAQPGLEGVVEVPDLATVVAMTLEITAQQTIDIPRILVVPRGEVRAGFKEFQLDLSNVNYQPISNELWQQELRTGKLRVLALGEGSIDELRLEDYVVAGLMDFDDVSYDDHSDLLYDLATQTVQHFLSYLGEEDTRRILRVYHREIARLIHAQMQEHYWEDALGYEVKVSKGFTEIKQQRAYTHVAGDGLKDFRQEPENKSNMSRYLFTGFQRGLYSEEKFQSNSERVLAIILDRDSLRWFKPAKGQFQIFYKIGGQDAEYQPDFVAETEDRIYMLEPKARNEMDDPEVLAKRDAGMLWCARASDHAATYNGKPWQYLLIPHDAIAENMTLKGLADRFAIS
jgi:type III restriction enzyme